MAEDHDKPHRLLFSFPRRLAELIRQFLGGQWVERLDFPTLPRNGDRADSRSPEKAAESASELPNVEAAAKEVSKDKLFKTALRYFLDNLVELIDPELAATLDLADPEFLPPEVFKDFQKFGHAIPDVAARVRTLEGRPRLLTLHVEVEGEFSAAMDERMKYYSMHLELEFRQPVVPIAVFLQGGPKGVEFRKVRTKVAKWEFSSTGYLAFGLSQCLAEDYVDRPQPLAPALAARMRSRLWDRAEKKLRCLLAVRRANLPLNREYVLARIVETQIDLKPEERERYRQLAQEQGKEVQKMVITWEDALAERWAAGLAEGEAKGLAEGEAKGLAEGEAKGKREATRQAIGLLAKHHHGSLPAGFEEKIAAIDDLSRLYEILEQVTEVRFLEELDLSP